MSALHFPDENVELARLGRSAGAGAIVRCPCPGRRAAAQPRGSSRGDSLRHSRRQCLSGRAGLALCRHAAAVARATGIDALGSRGDLPRRDCLSRGQPESAGAQPLVWLPGSVCDFAEADEGAGQAGLREGRANVQRSTFNVQRSKERLSAALKIATGALMDELAPDGHWVGELSSSALSTATAVTALTEIDRQNGTSQHERLIAAGLRWLTTHRNQDGGWGDTEKSRSNISTTALCWAALG